MRSCWLAIFFHCQDEYMNRETLIQRVEALLNMDVPCNFGSGGGSSYFTQQHANDCMFQLRFWFFLFSYVFDFVSFFARFVFLFYYILFSQFIWLLLQWWRIWLNTKIVQCISRIASLWAFMVHSNYSWNLKIQILWCLHLSHQKFQMLPRILRSQMSLALRLLFSSLMVEARISLSYMQLIVSFDTSWDFFFNF